MILLIVLISPFLLVVGFHLLTKKFLNPYKLIMVFGKKGSGKTTLMVKEALKYVARGKKVYTNTYIPFTYKIDEADIGLVQLPPDSVLMVDEVGMIWDNRDFKSFKNHVRDWFKLQRHYKVTVYLFSQTFDIDKKLRDLTDEMYIVEKKLRVFSYAKRILKKQVLIEASGESPSRIDENLQFDSLLFFLFGSRRLTFIPKYAKYFDSFAVPELKEKEFEYRESEEFKIFKGKIRKSRLKDGVDNLIS